MFSNRLYVVSEALEERRVEPFGDAFGVRALRGAAENLDGHANYVGDLLKAISKINKVVSSALGHGVLKISS